MKNSRIGETANLLLVAGHIPLYAPGQARLGDRVAFNKRKVF